MKKVLLGLVAMAMMGMMMTSCQKDEGLSKDTFTATTENGNSKTHLDGLNLKWDDEGESIMVMGSNYQRAEYFAISVTNDNTCATFACQEGEEVDADAYQIYYPASMVTANGTIELPVEQEYAENNVKGFPMYAETQGHAFQFTNLCGLFRLQLQKDDVVVRSISITTDKGVNGAFAVSTSAAGAFQFEAYTANDDAQKTVTLDCGNGVSIDELTDFNIYLPAGEYSTFDITITATDGSYCEKSLNGNALTINRNERVTLTREGEELEFIPRDVINGLFSIAPGTQVYFSKGNLDNNGSYFFVENQYNFGGTFRWNPVAGTLDILDDWGNYVDGNWRTLSYNEFYYLMVTRSDASSKKGWGTVNGVHGLILLPDAFTIPAGLNFNSNHYWTSNQYTAAEWAQMEAAGAVFLPAAGGRDEGYNESDRGYYWLSDVNSTNSDKVLNLTFRSAAAYYLSWQYSSRHSSKMSVRLVQEYHGN
ncbi:MAG: hypothetical protein MJZ77_00935 [Bacteroidales bacterium]|nr:hypothetical protein [Bacteroidales bacterium]